MKRHIDVAAIIALAIIAAFLAAYFRSPGNATLEGALVTAFAAAWGFFLGSSHGARASREQLSRIAADSLVGARPPAAPADPLAPPPSSKDR